MTLPDAGSTPAASTNLRPSNAKLVGLSLLLLSSFLPRAASAQDATQASIVWRGATHPVASSPTAGFSVPDALGALGLTASRDEGTGTLTISGQGPSILIAPGTRDVSVGDRIVALSKPPTEIRGVLYAPADFFEKVLFPLVGAAVSWDPDRRTWTLLDPTPAPLSLQVAVVHVAPTTQVVLRLSAPTRFVPRVIETGFQVRFPSQRLTPPFPERRYQDPLVSGVRFSADSAFIDFREPGLTARAYPLTDPDRIVIE
ncbi:MAG: copper amine oxidase N-terminal domain-containing protein, partial [Thermoanaerobaculia bacterium]